MHLPVTDSAVSCTLLHVPAPEQRPAPAETAADDTAAAGRAAGTDDGPPAAEQPAVSDPRTAFTNGLFAMQDLLRDVAATLRGEVAQLVADGFDEDQACAIVASQFGWRPRPEGDS